MKKPNYGDLVKEVVDEVLELGDEVIKEMIQPEIDNIKKKQKEGTRKFAQQQIEQMYQAEAEV